MPATPPAIQSPTPPPPLTLTIDDLTQTRADHATPTRMRFPRDADTTERLRRVVKWQLETDAVLPWYRRLLRLLLFLS